MYSLLASVRFRLFQVLEWLVEWRQKGSCQVLEHHLPADLSRYAPDRYLWVYATTIGELHAIQPLLLELLNTGEPTKLVILTDHPHYTGAFLNAFPEALIIDHGQDGKIVNEINRFPPDLFILAEIPCLLFDAPCRFSSRVIFELKKRDTAIVAVNGWLYGESPSCRMDSIEQALLQSDYLRAIDLFLVQTTDVRKQLLAAGAEETKVVVTGNIKFDAVFVGEKQLVTPEPLRPLMASLQSSGRPCIVAGCITNVSEQEYVLDAFARVLEKKPDTLLVLAPRHPENTERMALLAQLLKDRGLSFILRSEFDSGSLEQASVIVLDTIGELRHLYAASDVCFVGLNHNVLEPLALNKPVFVSTGWKEVYPSYPVYQETKRAGLITETRDRGELAEMLIGFLECGTEEQHEVQRTKLEALCGANKRNIELMSGIGIFSP